MNVDHPLHAATVAGTPSTPLADIAGLETWLCERALPTWFAAGTDWQQGGYFEKIGLDGRPIDEPRRARVVARQIYVWATAAHLGWHPRARDTMAHGLEFLQGRLRLADGSYAAAVTPDGQVVRGDFDLYEHAFVLFALASAHRAGHGDGAWDAIASELLATMHSRWAHPLAGFEEGRPRRLPLLSNPHMHLLEACLAWVEAGSSASAAWLALADEIAGLCLAHFIDPVTGAVREHFDGDWAAIGDAQQQVIEPGHQFEWAWLLWRWAALRQRPEAATAALRLIAIGEQRGVDGPRGVAVNALRGDLSIADPAAKLWPQTERLKAWCARVAAAQDGREAAAAFEQLSRAARGLRAYLLPAPAGLWREVMRADGGFVAEPCRASSLYHIVCAIETARALGAAVSGNGLRMGGSDPWLS